MAAAWNLLGLGGIFVYKIGYTISKGRGQFFKSNTRNTEETIPLNLVSIGCGHIGLYEGYKWKFVQLVLTNDGILYFVHQ